MLRWVTAFFDPYRGECLDCIARDEGECQCVTGTEVPSHCPEVRLHIQYEEIKLHGAAREMMERSTRNR